MPATTTSTTRAPRASRSSSAPRLERATLPDGRPCPWRSAKYCPPPFAAGGDVAVVEAWRAELTERTVGLLRIAHDLTAALENGDN